MRFDEIFYLTAEAYFNIYIHIYKYINVDSTPFHSTGPVSTVCYFGWAHVAQCVDSGGVLNTRQAGLRLFSTIFLTRNFTHAYRERHAYLHIFIGFVVPHLF